MDFSVTSGQQFIDSMRGKFPNLLGKFPNFVILE